MDAKSFESGRCVFETGEVDAAPHGFLYLGCQNAGQVPVGMDHQ